MTTADVRSLRLSSAACCGDPAFYLYLYGCMHVCRRSHCVIDTGVCVHNRHRSQCVIGMCMSVQSQVTLSVFVLCA